MSVTVLALTLSLSSLISYPSLILSEENGKRSMTKFCPSSFMIWNSKRHSQRLLWSERTLPLPGKTKITLLEKEIFFTVLRRGEESCSDPEGYFLLSFCSKRDVTSFLQCARCFAKGSFTWEVILFSQKCPVPLDLLPLQTSFLGRTCPHTYHPSLYVTKGYNCGVLFFFLLGAKIHVLQILKEKAKSEITCKFPFPSL